MGMSRSRLESDTSDDVALHEEEGEGLEGERGAEEEGGKGPGDGEEGGGGKRIQWLFASVWAQGRACRMMGDRAEINGSFVWGYGTCL